MGALPALLITIGVNVFVLIIIIALAILCSSIKSTLIACETQESPWCYSIQCPADDPSVGPCFGYSQRNGSKPGTFNCSSASGALVDAKGQPVS